MTTNVVRRGSGGSCDSNGGCRISPTTIRDDEGMADVEAAASRCASFKNLVTVIEDLEAFQGETIAEKLDTIIDSNVVVIIGWSHCPYCLDVRETLTNEVGVPVHVIETDSHSKDDAAEIQKAVFTKTGSKQMPFCFINGKSIGGCDEVRTLQANGKLDRMLGHLVVKKEPSSLQQSNAVRRRGASSAAFSSTFASMNNNNNTNTSAIMSLSSPMSLERRGKAVMPLFWFPPTVNHHVVRTTGVLSCLFAIASVVLVLVPSSVNMYGQWMAAYLVVDFGSRVLFGGSLSLISQVASLVVARITPPDLRPGPPKQFAACCGFLFALLGTIFFVLQVTIVGAVFMACLALATGMEGFCDFCCGCLFFSKCIQYGLVPEYIYRVHNASRPELMMALQSEDRGRTTTSTFKTRRRSEEARSSSAFASSVHEQQVVVTDPNCKIGLQYKIKKDDDKHDGFDLVRNMQAQYFGMPMSLAGIAAALKLGSSWGRNGIVGEDELASSELLSVSTWWSGAFGILGATCFAVMFGLYTIRMLRYPKKCVNEFDCPHRCGHFGYITTSLLLFAYLLDDWNGPLDARASEWTARCLLWIGAIAHTILVVTKIGEFVGMLHDLEHVHTTWLVLPVGSMVAAFIAPLVPMLGSSDDVENGLLAQFFYAFAFLLYVTLFVITFFKVVTTPNSNNAHRHSVSLWLAAPCTVGLANYSICMSYIDKNGSDSAVCGVDLAQYYFVGIMMLLCLIWAAFPYIAFFGRDPFSMGYWSECFALGMLAACAALFYRTNGFTTARVLMLIALTIAAAANCLAFLHTLTALRKRKIFTPTPKWGPLAYMKLTHEAIRAAIPKLRASLEQVNLLDRSNRGLNKFAHLFEQLKLVHEEHSRQENDVIFKTFNEYFPMHCDKYIHDHVDDEAKLSRWSRMIDTLLDPKAAASEKDTAYEHLMYNVPEFLDHQLVHMAGEEDNLQPIGRKYVPATLQKEIVKDAFLTTAGGSWEVMIPFVINNCPRHMQRVRYLKCLCWALPDRAQQIGGIVYRHVDAVMWERLRVELPEIVPRGERHWRRYY